MVSASLVARRINADRWTSPDRRHRSPENISWIVSLYAGFARCQWHGNGADSRHCNDFFAKSGVTTDPGKWRTLLFGRVYPSPRSQCWLTKIILAGSG